MFRSATANLLITLTLVILAVWLWFDPLFTSPNGLTLHRLLEKEALPMKPLPKAARLILDPQSMNLIRDHWGLSWPVSGELEGHGSEIEKLNRSLKQALDGQTAQALQSLGSRYQVYPQMVTGSEEEESDQLPASKAGLVAYGVYRYNRGVLLLERAGTWRSGDNKIRRDLRMALYDLRRAIGAFETLGNLGYWDGSPAWNGAVLESDDSGLPIHSAYANLATAYLRLGKIAGYPQVDPGYMRGEAQKYSDENSELSAMVSLLIQSNLSQRGGADLGRYRMTMALQNLEAGSRGLARAELARLNYQTAILINLARNYHSDIAAGDANKFLELAVYGGNKTDKPTALLAHKELALNYLEIENDDLFLEHLLASSSGALEDLLAGPDRDWGLLFTDLAQAEALARGELDRFFNHVQDRRKAFAAGTCDPKTEVFFEKIVEALAEVFFRDLTDRLNRMDQEGLATEAGKLVIDLEAILDEQRDPVLSSSYLMWCKPHLSHKIFLSLSLNQNPGSYAFFRWAPWFFSVLLVLYWFWVIRSHRRVGRQLFRSGYAEDLKGS